MGFPTLSPACWEMKSVSLSKISAAQAIGVIDQQQTEEHLLSFS